MNDKERKSLAAGILSMYSENQEHDIDELVRLDIRARRPVQILAVTIGIVTALIMGFGMSLIMTDISMVLGISSPMILGVAIGCLGIAVALVNYPLYKVLLAIRKEKFAPEIRKLSEKIIND